MKRDRVTTAETNLDDLFVFNLMESQLAQVEGFRERLGIVVHALSHY